MKFISILGYDRSGTTFLGSYLNHINGDIFYAGEIDKGIRIFFSGSNKKCTCGNIYAECPVWGKIFPFLDPDNIDLEFISNKIFELTGASVIVDSSKSFKYIRKFKKHFKGRYLSIHLKRNPKAVILSRMNLRKRRVNKGTHPKPYIAKKYNLMMIFDSLEWCYENIWFEKFKDEDTNLDLTYDFFGSELPSKILKFLEINNLDQLGNEKVVNHIVFGNKGRLNFRWKVEINHTWKNDLNKFQKLSVDLFTYPTRRIYNYSF
ncbi:sulfotransferase domain-containing protein [Christiangramia echinicola]|uniref:sulfotransferase domain-containing protein n=1 Tax=Christiangramia echinicola TaxID=279359 RepID=UPI0004166611|nr:sulfotransferase domain-containing protein [Christiangramia echinicola]